MTPLPSARRALIGSMLRRYRETRGYKLEDAARILECDPSKICRVETGQRGIHPKELGELLTEYEVDANAIKTLLTIARAGSTNGWWSDYRKVLPPNSIDFISVESVASHLWIYAPLQIPEVLWTYNYGLAVAVADPTISEGTEDAVVEAVTGYRKASLFNRRPECSIILGEAALRQQIGDQPIMRAQLTHLADLGGPSYPWLSIRILPFTASAHAAADSGGFSLLQFSGMPDLGLVKAAGPRGGIAFSDPSTVDAYAMTFRQTHPFTLNAQQSTLRLRQLASR